jgi:ABC-2 type transport system permease protein
MTPLLRAEQLRLRTVPAPLIAVAVVLAMTGLLVGFAFGLAPEDVAEDLAEAVRVPGVLSAVTMLVLGIVGGSSDHQHRTAESTYLVRPRRLDVFAARQLTYAVSGGLTGALTGLVSWLLAGVIGSARGLPAELTADPVELITGPAVAATLAGVLGVGVGYAARSTVAGIIGLMTWGVVGENLVGLLVPPTYLPMGAINATVGLSDAGQPLQGAIALAAYAAIAAVVAGRIVLPRDIT